MNRYKIIGFVLGISGVIFILGPTLNDNSNTVFGVLLVLAAACSYAVNTIFATRLPSYDPLVSSSCVLILASVISFVIWPDILYFNFVDLSFKNSAARAPIVDSVCIDGRANAHRRLHFIIFMAFSAFGMRKNNFFEFLILSIFGPWGHRHVVEGSICNRTHWSASKFVKKWNFDWKSLVLD